MLYALSTQKQGRHLRRVTPMQIPENLQTILTVGAVAGAGFASAIVAAKKALRSAAVEINQGQVNGQTSIQQGLTDLKDVVILLSKEVAKNRSEFFESFGNVRHDIQEMDKRMLELRIDLTKRDGEIADRVTALESAIENRVKIENRMAIIEAAFVGKSKTKKRP